MSEPRQRPLIRQCKARILEILREIDSADDLDLWQEVDGKLTDVILTYRRTQRVQPEAFTFSDGVTRSLNDFPAFLERDGRGM